MIERIFQDIPDGKLDEADQQSFLVSLGWLQGTTWGDLLRSRRVLLISEAGAGKTYECHAQAKRLWDEGEPAFYVELAALATGDLRDLLDDAEEERLDAWLSSQSEVATFFLDSIDELKLSQGSFSLALKRLKKAIRSQLSRARIVITTRPIPFDEQLVRQWLPIPSAPALKPSGEKFAEIAMFKCHGQKKDKNEDTIPEWRSVALMPLSDIQIIEFARDLGIDDPDLFLDDLQRRNAEEFARRPQDLIELCIDWREQKRIRTHLDQVTTNIRIKLLQQDGRPEPADLSADKAIEGASRLALSMQLTKRLTIRHNAASDIIDSEAALDPAIILSDWQPNERKALLERPLFGFASYGRVRFHHRSVAEFLAAQRLLTLRKRGMSFQALKRLLFVSTKGKTIVRPSKRPLAGWLALKEEGIFELLRDNEPAVLLDEGDPESLTQAQRNQALHAYCNRFRRGGRRGLSVPHIQVHRFASKELAGEINRIWQDGVDNLEVRAILINLIKEGRIDACADIVFDLVLDAKASSTERIIALDALISLDDKRLCKVVIDIVTYVERWPDRIAYNSVLRLFPKYISIEQLCSILRRVTLTKRSIDGFNRQLSKLIATSGFDFPTLEKLRDGLVQLVSEGLRWQKEWPHVMSDRAHLSGALATTCVRGLEVNQAGEWLHASVLALCLHHRDHASDDPVKLLRKCLTDLAARENALLFWTVDALLQSLHEIKDPWKRFVEITGHDGPVRLRLDRDLEWVSDALSDTTRDPDDRTLLLEAAICLQREFITQREHAERLKYLVADAPSLLKRIDEWLTPTKDDQELRRWAEEAAIQKEHTEFQKIQTRYSWIQFWREVANQPEEAFSSERGRHTAWYLWEAMRHDSDDSQSSGWNRRFIEEQFGKKTADRLRCVLMKMWRDDRPTLPSERPKSERNASLVRWHLGLAAIYAEAEDKNWAKRLSETEAQVAARYAPIELNSLPQWLEALVDAHPAAVDQTLGNELSWELDQAPGDNGHSFLLQEIDYAPTKVAGFFLPRLKSWLDAGGDRVDDASNATGMAESVRQVAGVILKHGADDAIANLLEMTRRRLEEDPSIELLHAWLPTLMRIDPASGVIALEAQVEAVKPPGSTEAVVWFADLFGDHWNAINLRDERFTPKLLLRLVRLVYRHVRIEDDVQHDEELSPGTRDDAQHARNQIVNALLNSKGEEGWAAKLEMATDPLCKHFNDRILAVAEENWAQEIDTIKLDADQAVDFDQRYEMPALTNEAMFSTLTDRLSDIDELLLRDDSPREEWAGITEERVMRRAISRELSHTANSIYTVNQEAVTADEKETDIRLRSTSSHYESVIELKIGDKRRSAKELLDTIEGQLVKKYMAPEERKAGVLLVTLAKDRKWRHPDGKRMINVEELFSLLRTEAVRVQEALGGNVLIGVHFLDLRPRLPLEKDQRAKKAKNKRHPIE